MITIDSIQIGKVVTEGDVDSRDANTRRWTSAFRKTPVADQVTVGPLGIVGDEVADTKHHGGVDKALLCYSVDHYASWQDEHPELEFSAGGFGENLTLQGGSESSVCLGDRWVCGDCEFEVSQPRQPCWKISRRWQTKTLTKEVVASGRTGWYLRVLIGGTLSTGSTIEVVDRPNPDWNVERANNVLFGRGSDPSDVSDLLQIPHLSDEWKASLR